MQKAAKSHHIEDLPMPRNIANEILEGLQEAFGNGKEAFESRMRPVGRILL
jgi:hypothetical protein